MAKAFAIAQFDGGLCRAAAERIDDRAADRHRVRAIQRADSRFHFQIDDIVVQHTGRKGQFHAERFILDRYIAIFDHGDGIFPTGKERRLLPRQGGQVGFGQRARHALGFQRLYQHLRRQATAADPKTKRSCGVPHACRGEIAGVQRAMCATGNLQAATKGLADAALHFGKPNFQHHLLRATHAHQV